MISPEIEDRQDTVEYLAKKVEFFINNGVPVGFRLKDVEVLRESLEKTGVSLDIPEEQRDRILGKEREKDTRRKKFRAKVKLDDGGEVAGVLIYEYGNGDKRWMKFDNLDLNQSPDRSSGVFAMLGEEKFKQLVGWCYLAVKEKRYDSRIISRKTGRPIEETRGRGLQQAAADILSICLLDPDDEHFDNELKRFTDSINKRLWKGFCKTIDNREEAFLMMNGFFQAAEISRPTELTASFPPDALPELLRFLTNPASE